MNSSNGHRIFEHFSIHTHTTVWTVRGARCCVAALCVFLFISIPNRLAGGLAASTWRRRSHIGRTQVAQQRGPGPLCFEDHQIVGRATVLLYWRLPPIASQADMRTRGQRFLMCESSSCKDLYARLAWQPIVNTDKWLRASKSMSTVCTNFMGR